MKKLNLALVAALTLGSLSANAADLSGHTMSCSVDLSSTFGGVQSTTYQFIKGVHGENIALIFSEGSVDNGTSNSPYVVEGSKLALTADAGHVDNDTAVYNISNPSSIRRTFKSCVFPGQGGGDAKPLCAQVNEICVLK